MTSMIINMTSVLLMNAPYNSLRCLTSIPTSQIFFLHCTALLLELRRDTLEREFWTSHYLRSGTQMAGRQVQVGTRH
jgi:hypothetical protein